MSVWYDKNFELYDLVETKKKKNRKCLIFDRLGLDSGQDLNSIKYKNRIWIS